MAGQFTYADYSSFHGAGRLPTTPAGVVVRGAPEVLYQYSLRIFFAPFPKFDRYGIILATVDADEAATEATECSPACYTVCGSPYCKGGFSEASVPIFGGSEDFIGFSVLVIPLS